MRRSYPQWILIGLALAGSAQGAVLAPMPPQQPAHSYSTKPAEGQVALAPMPFGKSTAAQDKASATGPKGVAAVPVEDIDSIETGEPAPPEPEETGANPAVDDPAEPTQLTAPMFSAQSNAPQRIAVLRVLNKVTARAEKLELKEGQPGISGKLKLTTSHCQHSDPTSLPDNAVLLTLSEWVTKDQPEKPLFSGWIYQSSPSVNALEHPIYDVTLVTCKDPPAPEPVPDKTAKKPAAAKKKPGR